jgi:integrase
MPKLSNRPPKYSKLKQYAVVYLNGKIHYLGTYGSEESRVAYARFIAERRVNPMLVPPDEGTSVTVAELAAAFLDHAKATLESSSYAHYRTVIGDFLLKLFGDDTSVDNFKPSSLKLVRQELILSQRFCRRLINSYIRQVVAVFTWGVEEEYVQPNTELALKAVKSLPEGYPGTFENEEREPVPDEVVKRTLPFMPPTLRAMILIQRLTGCRPSEIFNMRVGQIDKTTDPDLWLYRLPKHKTAKKTKRKKVIPLGTQEQSLIAPYLEGKEAEMAVFSPRTAMQERNAEKRTNRKTKISPSQAARNEARATKPRRYREFYDKNSYRKAVEYAIEKGNRVLPESEQIPHWTPYQLRHQAATALEIAGNIEDSMVLLDHESVETTKRYAHGRLEKLKALARKRVNPFAADGGEEAGDGNKVS